AHTASAAARRSFNDNGEPNLPSPLQRLTIGSDHSLRPRKDRHTVVSHCCARLLLFSHEPRDFRRRSDELDAASLAHLGEVGVLREQAISRMDCLYIGDLGGTDYGGNFQVTLCQFPRTE